MWKIVLVLCLILSIAQSKEVVSLPCPPPSGNCNCTSVETSDIICQGIYSLPLELPRKTTLLDISRNDFGPFIYGEIMRGLNEADLLYLYMSHCTIEFIDANSFVNMTGLRTLDISNNPLDEIIPETLNGLQNLLSLNLANTSLGEITADTFGNTPNLVHLDLHNNQLESIKFQFRDLSNLKTLLLHSNNLETIDEYAFVNLVSLTRLTLYSNKLFQPTFSWITYIMLNNGAIELEKEGMVSNPWKCCQDMIVFSAKLSNAYDTNDFYRQLDITCRAPYFNGKKITELALETLNIDCNSPPPSTSSPVMTAITSGMATIKSKHRDKNVTSHHHAPENPTKHAVDILTSGFSIGGKMLRSNERKITDHHEEVSNNPSSSSSSGNFLKNLTNTQMAIGILSITIFICFVAVVVVHIYAKRQRRKALHDFMQHLPVSEDGSKDSDSTADVSTRTFRQNIKVYGSTGTVIDRDTKLSSANDNAAFEEHTPSMKRKPPPYSPPKSSEDSVSNEDDEYTLQAWEARMVDHEEGESQFVEYKRENSMDPQDYSEDELFNSDTIRSKK